MSERNFDIVILGGGSAGYACALRAAQLNLSVVVIEQDRLGGTCLHNGCIPTKALLHVAEVADSARGAEQFGVEAFLTGIDMAGVHKYKDAVTARLFKGLVGLVASRGITLVEGRGRLMDPHTVEVDGQRFRGEHVVLATGSYARELPGVDVDGNTVLTSDHALTLDRVPQSVIVLGGGVIGCEFASVWRSFGAEVRIIEALPRLLPTEDEDSSKVLQRAFRKRGIKADVNTRVASVEKTDTGVRVTLEDGSTAEAEVLLVAVGRGPTTDEQELADAGVATARGFVVTDADLRTSQPSVYAVGDIVAGLQLAHRGFQHGIFVAEHIAGLRPKHIDEVTIPRVTYCEPQVASVGLTEAQAREKHGGEGVQTVTYDLGGNGKSQIVKTSGFIKLVRENGGSLVGVHIVGHNAGELIGEAQVVHGLDLDVSAIAELTHAHPTQSEVLGEAFMALAGKPLHAHS
jgi:dihydrolipoamide dehydrogenase